MGPMHLISSATEDAAASYVPRLGEPLGPDSLTWRTLGDLRLLLVGMRAGLLQAMHPDIDQALKDHSNYFEGPFKRILRSVPQIAGVVYDADARGVATKVRSYHKPIHGTHPSGERYHALDPDPYYWAHATFFEAQIAAMHYFGTELSDEDKERLYQESIQWYSLYGLSMRSVPDTYADFCEYWDRMIAEVLQPNAFSRGTFKRRKGAFGPSPTPLLPDVAWHAVSDPMYRSGVWIIRATLPPVLRERMGLEWTPRDERTLAVLGFTLRQTFGRLPWWWRMAPQVRAAYRREMAADLRASSAGEQNSGTTLVTDSA